MTDPTDFVFWIHEGDLIAGKYRVEKVLGVGGMGVVVAAHHVELDDRVAIKFLRRETLGDQEAVARFAREARAAVKIKSEHVAKVTDVGKLEDGSPYMVMEYLDGTDLSEQLRQRGTLSVEQTVDFVLQAGEAIAEAHSLGIVHRDLKPPNLFVVGQPDGTLSIKVLDFGISKIASTGAGLTQTSALMGSPLYMSPEQIRSSKDVDARTDIWSLGVILYELLVGRCPFVADSMPQLVFQIMTKPAPRLTEGRSDVPAALEQVVGRCLEKDPNERFRTVAELAIALLPFGPKRSKASVERISGILYTAGLAERVPELSTSSDLEKPPGVTTEVSWSQTTSEKKRRSWLLFAVAALTALGGGGIALIVKRPLGAAAAPSAMLATPIASDPNMVGNITAGVPAPAPSASPAREPWVPSSPALAETSALPSSIPSMPVPLERSVPHRASRHVESAAGTSTATPSVSTPHSPLDIRPQ